LVTGSLGDQLDLDCNGAAESKASVDPSAARCISVKDLRHYTYGSEAVTPVQESKPNGCDTYCNVRFLRFFARKRTVF
jgi:hypothetical protein